MQGPFGHTPGNHAGGGAAAGAVNRLVDAKPYEKRTILEREQGVLLASEAIYWLWFIIHQFAQAAQEGFRSLGQKSPQERDFQMLNFGVGVGQQAKAQYFLLHLTLMRDARDQGIPTAFSYFDKGHAAFIQSGLLGADIAAVRATLASGFLTFDELATIQALVDLQNAIMAHRTWEATRTVLTEKSTVLLNGLAEFLIEKDSDNIREGTIPSRNPEFELKKNDAYRDLLRNARQIGIPTAWQHFQQRVREIEQS